MLNLPSGTVAFVLTDVENATGRFMADEGQMAAVLRRHDEIITSEVQRHNGFLLKKLGEGDSHFTVFSRATDAVAAALAVQLATLREPWPTDTPLLVRIGIHAGEAELRDGDYFGSAPSIAQRLRESAHGGQTLLSQTARDLVATALPEGAGLADLGFFHLKGVPDRAHIYELTHPALTADFPPLRTPEDPPTNLRRELTRFVGRELEIVTLTDLVQRYQLVTLTGASGSGKTRLANELGHRIAGDFADGLWVVELADVADADLVPRSIASVLHLAEQPGLSTMELVLHSLRYKRMLLLLDNCEHLVQGVGLFVNELLRRCRNVRVLTTSRAPLNLYGEHLYTVPTLQVPDTDAELSAASCGEIESVQLLVERAKLKMADFVLSDANAPALVAICRSLDGMPLAIELAAAQMPLLAPAEIADQLEKSIAILRDDARGKMPRHRTIEAAIDWSYDHLTAPEQRLFVQLAVFRGPFDLEAVRSIGAGDAADIDALMKKMSGLLDKSMIITVPEWRSHARFRLLEPLRQYALARLEPSVEFGTLQRRHAEHYLALAQQSQAGLQTSDQSAWLDTLTDAHDNLRAAMGWTIKHDEVDLGLRLGGALWRFWYMRGHLNEGYGYLNRMLERPGLVEEAGTRAEALHGAGVLAMFLGEYAAARRLFDDSLAIRRQIGDEVGVMRCLNNLGIAAFEEGDYAGARDLYAQSLEIQRAVGDDRSIAIALSNLASAAAEECDLPAAQKLAAESLRIRRKLRDQSAISSSLTGLAIIATYRGDYDRARGLVEDSLRIERSLQSPQGIAQCTRLLGQISHDQGDLVMARKLIRESLAVERELGNRRSIAEALNFLGAVAYDESRYVEAKKFFEEARAMSEAIGRRRGLVNALDGLGRVAMRQRLPWEAESHLTRALEISCDMHCYLTTVRGVESIAVLAILEGHTERAMRLAGAASRMRADRGVPISPLRGAELETVLTAARASVSPEDGQAAFEAGRAMDIASVLDYVLSGQDG